MRHFPIFMKVAGKRILVTGGGETAIAKLQLLLNTDAEIVVFAEKPLRQIDEWDRAGKLVLERRIIGAADFFNTAMVDRHPVTIAIGEHDWHDLARDGAVAAIYMGLKQAYFFSGRLLMHGANSDIPVTIMENVSRPDQRISLSSVGRLGRDAEACGTDGPAILMLGLEPREVSAAQIEFEDNTLDREVV